MTWDLKEPECLTQARLITAAPEFVFEQLKFYGENVGKGHGKAELENQLLIRDDKLINLALAQFGTDKAIVVELYNRTSDNHTNPDHEAYDKGLRVACLSNRHFDYFNWPDFDLNALMSKGLSPEAAALLSNPSVPPSVLVTLFKKTESFSQVDEKNWLWMIQTAANNERLNTDESTIDGPDMGLWDIHKAIFHFLETAPVTSHSVHATRTLLNALEPKHCAWPDEISYIIDRWRKAEVKNYKGDVEEGWSTHLPLSEELACLIGILYGHRSTTQKNKPSLFGTADDKDIPLRCAYYGCAQMSKKETIAGYEKDKNVFLFAALKNESLYLNKKTRALLEHYIGGDFRHEYKHRCQQIQKTHKWFDPRPTTETGRDVMEDLNPESSRETTLLENINRQNAVLIDRIANYERRLYWAIIIVIGVMYYLLKG